MSTEGAEIDPATVTVPPDLSAEEVRAAIRLWRLMDNPEGTLAEWDDRGYGDR